MKAHYFFIFVFILFSNTESRALERISLGVGKSTESVKVCRLGLQRLFGSRWIESKTGYFSGYHELSLNYWENEDESATAVAYSPVFTYGVAGLDHILPYLEAGIGISYLSEKRIDGRNLSSHFQFEDRIGIGTRIGKQEAHDLNLRCIHYSNAGIKQPNEGIEIFILSYSHLF